MGKFLINIGMSHFKKIGIYAKKKGCKIGLITNGSKFEGDSLENLISSEIDLIEFSVDSSHPFINS